MSRSLLIDTCFDGERRYFLPPPMAGFFEFSMMRTDGRLDKQALAELFHRYMNVEDEFVRELYEGETQLGRALVHEPALSIDDELHVLDYERASAIIGDAHHLAVGLCYCRHKMEHVGKACDAPLELCLSLNDAAETLIRQGIVRAIEPAEGLDLLAEAYEHDLVQFAENVRRGVNFICNCCRCCCETMIAARRFAVLRPVHTTRFMPVADRAGLQRLRAVHRALPGRGDPPGAARRRADGRPHRLHRLRRLQPHLPAARDRAHRAPRTHHHAARFGAPHGRHGHRARQAAEPDLLRSRGSPATARWPPCWASSCACRRSSRSWPASR